MQRIIGRCRQRVTPTLTLTLPLRGEGTFGDCSRPRRPQFGQQRLGNFPLPLGEG